MSRERIQQTDPPVDSRTVTPLTIEADWQPIVEAYTMAYPERAEVIWRFVRTIYPYHLDAHLGLTIELYWTYVLDLLSTDSSSRTLDHFCKWHSDTYASALLNKAPEPAKNYPIHYGLLSLAKTSLKGLSEPVKVEIGQTIARLVNETNFADPRFSAGVLETHMRAFRLVLRGLFDTPEFADLLRSQARIEDGLRLPELASDMETWRAYHDLNEEEKKYTPIPKLIHDGGKINSTIGGHYFTLMSLLDGEHQLGMGERTVTSHDSAGSQRKSVETDCSIENARHRDITHRLNEKQTESHSGSDSYTLAQAKRAKLLSEMEPKTLASEIRKLSQGDPTSVLTGIAQLRDYSGASEPCILFAIRKLQAGMVVANTPHPTRNHILTVSQLMSDWLYLLELSKSDIEYRLLAYELLLIMLTGIPVKRLTQTGTSSFSKRSRVYIKRNGELHYLFDPRPENTLNEKVILLINSELARVLWEAVDDAGYAHPFKGFKARYKRAKKQLARGNRYLPRLASQFGHAAREILRVILSDYDFDILTGAPTFANQVEHYYVATDIAAINRRYARAINAFIARLKPSILAKLPLIEVDPQNLVLPQLDTIGSETYQHRFAILELVNQLNAKAELLQNDIDAALRRHKDPSGLLISALNTLALNRAVLANLAGSARWHQHRTLQIRTTRSLYVEDKNVKRYREARFCCVSEGENALLELLSQQDLELTELLNLIADYPTGLSVDWASIDRQHHNAYTYFTRELTPFGLEAVAKPLGRNELADLLVDLALDIPSFALNTLRHVFSTVGNDLLPRPVQNEQTGRKLAGMDVLHKTSSGNFSSLVSASHVLDSHANRLGLKALSVRFKMRRLNHAC